MELIHKKYSIKNTTGYSINALADFPPSDPIEIVKRLMIGSEGTLGFVSRVTYKTVPDHRHKASAFIVFPDIGDACDATSVLRKETSVDAVEIFDRRSLKLCAEMEPNPNANPNPSPSPSPNPNHNPNPTPTPNQVRRDGADGAAVPGDRHAPRRRGGRRL